jgi:endoglucanase
MRLTSVPTLTVAVLLCALAGCASGKATDSSIYQPPASGGTSTTMAPSGGNTVVQGGTTASPTGRGGTTTTSATGSGGNSKGGTTATGGATTSATGGAAVCSAPAQPVASWKSFASCKATPTEMSSAYTSWKTAYFQDCGSQAYIKSTDPNGSQNVVSEGIGYGMLAAANLNQSADFDKLWAFYKQRLNTHGVMGWKYPLACTGNAQDTNSASDADVDAAMALIVAAKTFSKAAYLNDAKTLIASIKSSETATCSGKSILKASDGSFANCDELNPSYFAPGYYRIFGIVANDATFWNKMATDALALLATWQSKLGNGQVPDWGRSDGSLGSPSHSSATTYGADACRTPWRVAVDYGWNQSADAKAFLTTMNDAIVKAGGRPYFMITGKTDTQNSSPFVGGYATVGTAFDQATADTYFSDWYVQRSLPGDSTYYANTLKLLYLITMGGRFDNGQ